MKVTKKHPVTQEENTLDLDITPKQYEDWTNGMLIQNAMPQLDPDEREFLISGLLPGEYDDMFKDN